MKKGIALITAVFISWGCCSTTTVKAGPGNDPAMLRNNWVVRSIDSGPVLFRTHVTIRFDDRGEFTGKSGCNAFSGHYDASVGAISLTGLSVTRRTCRPDIMMQEKHFLSLLESIIRFGFDERGRLIMTTAEGEGVRADPS